MRQNRRQQLQNELFTAGANAAEIKELLPIASKLKLLEDNNTSAVGEREKENRWLKIVKPVSFSALGLALGMYLVIIAQAALPTSVLYPVQKFSDHIAVSIHSQYRASVMMKRAQQVNQLVANHTDSKQVLATLADYTSEASAYKATPHTNYAALEYCKTNLMQALATATPNVRQAILSSLQSLGTT